jgi:hypothetical protein
VVKGLIWYTDEFRTPGEAEAGVYEQFLGSRLRIPLGKHATLFQAEIYAMLACVYEIQTNVRSQKYNSICCVNQAALKALQYAKTRPHWYGSAKGR